MLKNIFTSNVRVKILDLLLRNPEKQYFIRELTRILEEQINSVRRELENLHKIGLVQYKSKNQKKYFYINKNFLIFKELQAIFEKCNQNYSVLVDKILTTGSVQLVVLTGIFIGKPGDLDLFIVGEINKAKLLQELEAYTNKTVQYAVLTQEDYLYRLKINDKYIYDLLNNPDNYVVYTK